MNNKIDRFLRRKEVEDRVGFSRATIYRMIKADQFPKPIAFNRQSVRWREKDIETWQQQKVEQSTAS